VLVLFRIYAYLYIRLGSPLLSNSDSSQSTPHLRGQLEVEFKYNDDGEKTPPPPTAAPLTSQELKNDEGKDLYLLLKQNIYESLISLVHNDQCRTSDECVDE
jgi:hypothetical protein